MIRAGALFVLLLIIPAHAQTVAVPPGFDPHLIANVYATALAFMAPRTLEPVAVSQLTIWGLRGLTALDPELTAELRDGKLHLAIIAHLDIDRDFRQQGHAIAARNHLQDGRQTRRAELSMCGIALPTINERLIAQTVAFFQQHQAAHFHIVRPHPGAFRKGIVRGHCEQEPVVEQHNGFKLRLL